MPCSPRRAASFWRSARSAGRGHGSASIRARGTALPAPGREPRERGVEIPMASESSSGVATPRFGGTVQTVLATPRIEPAPASLEQARNAPGRSERIAELTKFIEANGIRYVYFQQVSVTGRVMGKGVVSTFFPQVAERGYQLVYGATANLFTDRHGDYIGFGPEESELAAIADLDTFRVLPWDPRVARVMCDCYDTETGALLDADPRQNLKRVAHDFEEEL